MVFAGAHNLAERFAVQADSSHDGFTGFDRMTFGKGQSPKVILFYPVNLIDRSCTLENLRIVVLLVA
jgi:hypothetical protein